MKGQIRKETLALRDALSVSEKQEKENAIIEKLLPLLEGKRIIALYLPKGKEADMTSLLFLYRQVGVPKVRNDKDMDFYLISGIEDVEEGHFGVLEPKTNIWIDPQDIDVILVPLVAFNSRKHRIGYGKGYYDRYLRKCSALKIGIAFSFQKDDRCWEEEQDVALDVIVSDEEIYR